MTRDVLLVLISTSGAVAASLGAQYLAGRTNQSQAAAEAKLQREHELRQVLARLLMAAENIEAQTAGSIATRTLADPSSDSIRALSTARAEARLAVPREQYVELDELIIAVLIRSNAHRAGSLSDQRQAAAGAARDQGLLDDKRMDQLRDAFVGAAQRAIATA